MLSEASGWAATAEACSAPRLTIEVPSGDDWQTAPAELAEHLRGLSDLDRCAHLFVSPYQTGVIVRITTGDGRKASRQANNVAELLRAAEALLVLPAQSAAPTASVSRSETPPPDPIPEMPPPSTHIELGLGGSLRFGGGPAYGGGGLTAFSQFALDHWLLDVAARVDLADALLNQPPPSDFRMQSSAVGVAVGRRLEFDGTRVDGLLGSNVVLESQDADQSNREIHGAAADFRLAVALRVSAPRASSVRAYVTADFEASPARIRTQRHIDRSLPSLPWWSSGVAIGVLWGAR